VDTFSAGFEEGSPPSQLQENLFVQQNRHVKELTARVSLYAGNITLNMDLLRMRGATLMSFEEGKPILLKIRGIMPFVEKAKALLTVQPQVDRSPLNRNTDDKLAKVQTAIEVFSNEIQAIMQALSENVDTFAEEDLQDLADSLSKVDELSDVTALDDS